MERLFVSTSLTTLTSVKSNVVDGDGGEAKWSLPVQFGSLFIEGVRVNQIDLRRNEVHFLQSFLRVILKAQF